MNKIPNREIICDELVKSARIDEKITVLTSDSRGSAKLQPFYDEHRDKYIEVGIAEQNIVGIAAGLASSGLKPYVVSPACFLSMRSIEQIKVDVAYSNTNVKLVGISGGVSYGALGMSHHSLQDIAVMRAIPGIDVVIPADRFETKKLIEASLKSNKGMYIRVGRNPVEDVYENDDYDFEIGKAVTMREGVEATIIACGETVKVAIDAHESLKKQGINCRVLNMHTLKPFDNEAVIKAAKDTGAIISLEEHSIHGGLGAAIAEVVGENYPIPLKIIGIPDEPAIAGESKEVFNHYGIEKNNVAEEIKKLISKKVK